MREKRDRLSGSKAASASSSSVSSSSSSAAAAAAAAAAGIDYFQRGAKRQHLPPAGRGAARHIQQPVRDAGRQMPLSSSFHIFTEERGW